ncbi:matrin-3-like isoform X2 [Myxocyprinus asiaticus]|uniref:matrin-3-like isoform X2 n=1 Tax=Myxocyprinus asiaticus TaxID=70543 RepID=UPI00222132A9|nr:matrin-3-like isoform X2 [Myxocyprinus asiaticus]
MSYNQTYRNPPDNMYSDSQRMYTRESSAHRSRIRTTSSEQTPSSSEASVLPTGKALSFLHSCGLDAEDLKTLAELPEHLITAETLPDLLAEIKKKKTVNTSSSRSCSSARSWEDRSHTPVEYPFDLPVRQSYHREQVPTWEDPWGNVQKTSVPTRSYTISESNYVVEYNHLKDNEFYFDKAHFAAEKSRQKTSVASQSYSNYSRDNSQPSHLSSRAIGQPSQPSSRDVSQSSHLSSRDLGIPSLLSSRNASQSSHLSSRDINQPSHHWRTEMVHKVPTRKEASDFHGKIPPVFPYACVLCEITVLSYKDWSVHIKGAQHANSQLSLVEKYPEWDQSIQSARRNELVPEISQPRATQGRGGTSGSRNRSSGSRSGLSSSKSESSSSNQKKTEERCKVVCIKFEAEEVDEKYLKKLLGQFGPIVKMIVFPKLAFMEMGSAEQADDIVKYFLHNPLRIKGQLLEFTLSAAFSFLQSSCVVSFSPLPVGEGISSELIAIAKRFGSVKHSLFLPSRGYVEMASPQEASKLVEHYSTNSLKLKGKTINVCFSSEYKTLGEKGDKKEISPISQSSTRRRRRSASPQRRSHSSRRVSPSPKRRSSEERTRSHRSYDSKKQDNSRHSRERTKQSSRRESSRRDSSYKAHSRKSPSKDQGNKTDESAKEKIKEKIDDKKDQSDTVEDNNKDQSDTMEDDTNDQSNTMEDDTKDQSSTMEDDIKDQSDTMEDDSDLEGVAVIADDGEELNSEDDELAEDAEPDDQAQDASVNTNELETSEDMPSVEQSNDQTIPSDKAVSNVHSETSEPLPDATATSGSRDFKEAQELKQEQEAQKDQTVAIEEEVANFPENLENHVTLDEFEEEVGKDHVTEQGDDQEILASSTEVEKALIEMENSTHTAKIEAESSKKKIKLGGRTLRITVPKTYTSVKEGKCVDSECGEVESEEQVEEIDKELSHSETSCEESSGMLQETIKISEEGAEAPVESTIDTDMQTSSDEEGLIEMENASDAEKVVAAANMNKITIAGKHPKIAVSTKHTHLNKRHFHHRSSDGTVQKPAEVEGAEDGSKTQNNISDQLSESLSVKESSNDEQGVNFEGDEKQLSASDETETMVENSDSSETQTHLNDPAGTEFVRPVVGYFCSLCNAIYASEEEAKNEHCRTALHYQKLKEYMEQKS